MENTMTNSEVSRRTSKLGFILSIATAVLAAITFGIAICTPPFSGPFCISGCFEYPYLNIAERFPRDYYWMYPAILVSLLYLIMMICLYQVAPLQKKVYGMAGAAFALLSALILSVDYYIQVSVIPPSLLAGETEGIALLTQFNPHGIFIALEEMGFMLIVLSLFVVSPVFDGRNALERSLKWIAIVCLFIALLTFTLISVSFGIEREYRFEVAIISIAWLELIVWSILLARFFKRKHVNS